MQTATHDNTPAVANGNGSHADGLPEMETRRAPLTFEGGVPVIKTEHDIWRLATWIAKSGLAPTIRANINGRWQDVEDTPEAIAVKIIFGMQVGLPPMAAVQNVANVKGRPSLFGDAILAVCRQSPFWSEEHFSKEMIGEPYTDDWGCKVTMGRRYGSKPGDVNVHTELYTLAQAKAAGLYPCEKNTVPWMSATDRMLYARSLTRGARTLFTETLTGIYLRDEAEEIATAEAHVVRPSIDVPVQPVAAIPAPPASPAPAPSPVESPAPVPAEQSTDDTPPAFDPLPDDLAVDQVWRSEPGTLPHRFYIIADIVDSDPAVQPIARAWFSDDKELTATPTWNRDLSDRPRRATLTADDFLSLSRVELPTPPDNGGGDVATGNYSESPNSSPDPVAQAEATVADWSATQGQGETWNTPEGEPPSRVSVEETSAGFNISGPLGWVVVESAGDGALSDAQKKYLADTENAMAEAGTECPDLIEGVRSLFHAGFVLPTAVARVVSAYVARHGQKKFSNLRVEEKRFFREIASRYAVARRDNTPPA